MQHNHSYQLTGKYYIQDDFLNRRKIVAWEMRCSLCNYKSFEDSYLTSVELDAYIAANKLMKEHGVHSVVELINFIEEAIQIDPRELPIPKEIGLTVEEYIKVLRLAHTHYMRKLLLVPAA